MEQAGYIYFYSVAAVVAYVVGIFDLCSVRYLFCSYSCLGERGVSVAQASRDLDVHENVLRKWVKEFGSDPKQAFPGHEGAVNLGLLMIGFTALGLVAQLLLHRRRA